MKDGNIQRNNTGFPCDTGSTALHGEAEFLREVIINYGYQGGRDFLGVPKPVVTFYQTMRGFISFLLSYQNFLSQILKSMGTKTSSYL